VITILYVVMAGEFMAGEFDQQRIARLTPLAEVLARIDALVKPVAPRRAAASTALGRVLAEDVVTASPVPAFARALRDGFAVAADAVSDASSYAPVPLVPPQRVDLGDALPAGADAVAPLDAVVGRDGRFEAIAPVAPGDGVLAAGTDMGAGTVPRRAGNRLRAADIAAFAAAEIGAVSIREPRVLLATARPGDAVAGGIRGLLTAAAAASGASCRAIGVGDLAAVLGNAEADAVLVIGGTGAGRNDTSVRALAAAGRVEVHGVALSPGETAAFGVVGERPVLLFPGRLDAALAVWLTLGGHLLARLSGCAEGTPATSAVLTRKHASPLGLTELVPVRSRGGKAEPIASGYWPLQALAQSDGWILVPADSEGYPAGAEVMIQRWP
jgi:molybdopterin biosynthesis enzyme